MAWIHQVQVFTIDETGDRSRLRRFIYRAVQVAGLCGLFEIVDIVPASWKDTTIRFRVLWVLILRDTFESPPICRSDFDVSYHRGSAEAMLHLVVLDIGDERLQVLVTFPRLMIKAA